MGRVCRTNGRAVLLTGHKGAIARAVKNCELWKQMEVKKICMGGLNVVVYHLQRTNEPWTPFVKKEKGEKGKDGKREDERMEVLDDKEDEKGDVGDAKRR